MEGEEFVRGKLPSKDIALYLWDYKKRFRKGQEFCYWYLKGKESSLHSSKIYFPLITKTASLPPNTF